VAQLINPFMVLMRILAKCFIYDSIYSNFF